MRSQHFFVILKLKVGFRWKGLWVNYQASPKFMAPIHSGLTLTAAEGESKRCLASRDLGGGAGFIVFRFQMQVLDEMIYIYNCIIKGNMIETVKVSN